MANTGSPFSSHVEYLNQHGYAMLESVLDTTAVTRLTEQLAASFEDEQTASVLRSRGHTYGSRNLLDVFPGVVDWLRCSSLGEFATIVLGTNVGIVRVLYFDKPPNRSWSLPWHRDMTIAVKKNSLASNHFCNPTVKAGVPHVVAPNSLLEAMVTFRIHLDPMTDGNGPLCVIPGSHRPESPSEQLPVELHAQAGDVLAMRPLLSHSSKLSQPGTILHRRVIHFELAPSRELPDRFEWYSFVPLR
ncbi:MAG: phytanoyl-CoA dioxygenase family protein [Planctomycetota bacterium]|nr:phytanoyl-CoA dioxygenase family protein [Planctomycetota bacterium]MDA1177524.1 phytanoyl-CoA dioxygenase family protein [Planctomycetota bacterium]